MGGARPRRIVPRGRPTTVSTGPGPVTGRTAARQYLDAFFAAIETDAAFYRPVIVARTAVMSDAAARRACPEEAPAGTPVAPRETAGDKSRVIVLDALWQWAEKCEAVRLNPVWIPTAVISENYPAK